MRAAAIFLTVIILSVITSSAYGQTALPLVEDVEFEGLKDQCRRLLEALQTIKAPLPAETTRALKTLTENGSNGPAAAASKIQKLLDPYCLIGVTINPESRVKATRGSAAAELTQNKEVVLLIKVHNDGGVTHALKVTSPQIRSPGESERGRWLEANLYREAPLRKTLSGQKVEYVILRLTAREAGKREATLKFDVGQGTQDLGFRADVPVLFIVRPAER